MSLISRLIEEHEEFRRLGRQIEGLMRAPAPQQDPARVARLVREMREKLLRHSRIEDEEFYPALRRVMANSRFLNQAYMDHLDHEHRTIEAHAEKLMAQVSGPRPAFGWGQTFAIFSVGLRSHMRREEEELFPEADRLFRSERPAAP